MCLIGVKETYVQKKKQNILGQICTTVSPQVIYKTVMTRF